MNRGIEVCEIVKGRTYGVALADSRRPISLEKETDKSGIIGKCKWT